VLFINKVDRLIKEVKLTPEAMQERFVKIITHVNKLIGEIAPEGYKEKFKVNVGDGSVAFGSAFNNWAMSVPYMKENNISFKDVIDAYENDDSKALAKKAPLHEVVLQMSVEHHPNPVDAQKYRIPKIWHGDSETEVGKGLVNCNASGDLAFVPIKIVVDKHAGEVAAGRLFSGTVKQGDEVYMNLAKTKTRVQQVSVYKGAQRVIVEEVLAGNIVGIVGLRDVVVGETVSTSEMEPFEAITHLFDPVVTKSIEPMKSADLPKLVDVLRRVGKEDPSLKIEINEQTGENLISGMGELHLEIIENRIRTEKGLDVKTSAPIIVYRETVAQDSNAYEGRSPNKHNSFFIRVEPMENNVYEAIVRGDLPEGRIKKRNDQVTSTLSALGMGGDEIKSIKNIYKGNMFIDETRGEVHMIEVIELILDSFQQVMDQGPLAREPCTKMNIIIEDIKLHEDAIHRGPAQVYPAVRDAISGAMKQIGATMLEPLQTHVIEAPNDFMASITKLVSSKRGQLINVDQGESGVTIKAKLPVAEMIGWSSDLRSATEGRGVSSLLDQEFDMMPRDLQAEVVKKIRSRKGLAENQ
jgi:elongation factor 2